MKRIKYGIMIFMAICFLNGNAFSLTINSQAPDYSAVNPLLDAAVSGMFSTILTDLNNDIGTIKDNPVKLAESFANAGTYSNFAATQRGYQGYDLFAITAGSMFAGKMSSFDINKLKGVDNELKNNGDVEVGAGWQTWAIQVGLNTSRWIIEDLYLGLKFGVAKFNMPLGDNKLKVDYISIGALANYQVLKERALTGALVWRGISVGSGLIYQKNATGIILNLDEKTTISGQYSMEIDPNLTFALDSNIVTIPLEVTTAVRLAWFLNLSVGVGADINFGKSNLTARIDSDINAYDTGVLVEPDTPGYIRTNAGVDGANPKVFSPKLMAGLGFCIGPVILDLPMTWYISKGFNVGVSAGVVW